MGEKGNERRRLSGLVGTKKDHVRTMKNNQGQGLNICIPTAPIAIKSPEPFGDGLSKRGKRLNESSVFSVSPNSKRGGSPGGSFSPKTGSPRTSPSLGCHYAGAKFSEPPSPDSLPKPPMRWTGMCSSPFNSDGRGNYREISQQLKMALKVQA